MLPILLALWSMVGAVQPGNEPAEPFRIADNVYYVGTRDMAVLLVTTPAGHVLIDGGYPNTPPLIVASIRKLGFEPRDVRIILNTQAHFDHAGGFAELKRLTGARLMIADPDADLVERGGRGDFLFKDANPFPPAHVDRRLKDGDTVSLGGVVLTAHVTGGHTRGCTTWTFDATDRGRRYRVVDVGGTSVLDGMRLNGMPGYPSIGADFARTFAVLESLPCDLFLGAHAAYFDGEAKAARLRQQPEGPNPFVDPDGYRAFVEQAKSRFLAARAAAVR